MGKNSLSNAELIELCLELEEKIDMTAQTIFEIKTRLTIFEEVSHLNSLASRILFFRLGMVDDFYDQLLFENVDAVISSRINFLQSTESFSDEVKRQFISIAEDLATSLRKTIADDRDEFNQQKEQFLDSEI